VVRFVPDCAVFFARVLRDPRVPRRERVLLSGVVGYLALPFDLIPDFIPVAGQLDDAVVVVLALRALVRRAGPAVIHDHWPGPASSRDLMLRLAGVEVAPSGTTSSMECRCATMNESFGQEAETYAAEHLVRGEADSGAMEERYSCPDTGRRFVLDWPERTQSDTGQARLRLET
jgi:uncharacterized membrane protein YkvA (DUF1232 family)